MKCFYHPHADAVGVCHCCKRGVCPQCAQEVGRPIACKDRCEDDVRALEAIAPTQERIQRDQREMRILSTVFILLGVLLLEWSGLRILILHEPVDFSMFMCSGLLVCFGGMFYFVWRSAADRGRG